MQSDYNVVTIVCFKSIVNVYKILANSRSPVTRCPVVDEHIGLYQSGCVPSHQPTPFGPSEAINLGTGNSFPSIAASHSLFCDFGMAGHALHYNAMRLAAKGVNQR
jgi:hypothetical protein